jgi:hypothetical protein
VSAASLDLPHDVRILLSGDAGRRGVSERPPVDQGALDLRPTGSEPASARAALPHTEPSAGAVRDEGPERERQGPGDHQAERRGGGDAGPEARPEVDAEAATVAVSAVRDRGPVGPSGPGEPVQAGGVPRPVVEQVVERLRLVRGDGRHELSIRLDPPDLGTVRVEAVMDGHRLALVIQAEADHARDALLQGLPRLREALAQHGIVVEHSRVSLGLDTSPGGDSGRGHRPFEPEPVLPPPVRPLGRDPHPMAPAARTRGVDLWA